MQNSDKWTDAEVQALLNIYAMEEIQCDFEGTKITSTPHNFAVRMQPGKRPGGPKVPGELADHLVPVS